MKKVTVRLSDAELEAAARLPGETLSDQIRMALLHQTTAAAIAVKVASEVDKKLLPLLTHFSALQQQVEHQQRQIEQYTSAAKMAAGSAATIADQVSAAVTISDKKNAERIQILVESLNKIFAQQQQRR